MTDSAAKSEAQTDASKDQGNPADRLVRLQAAYAQSKACNLLTAVFAICGFILFSVIYTKRIAPDFIEAMRDISTIGLIITVFLPAVLLSFLAKRYEKRYLALLKQE